MIRKNIKLSTSQGMTIAEARNQKKVDMSPINVKRITGRKQNILRVNKTKK